MGEEHFSILSVKKQFVSQEPVLVTLIYISVSNTGSSTWYRLIVGLPSVKDKWFSPSHSDPNLSYKIVAGIKMKGDSEAMITDKLNHLELRTLICCVWFYSS